ncbi:MAG: right-handed parallel beta-helix repeat-containing protein [Planctomycetes bacterium]|nr:right-handed parallel beta-helix repeat-containing protein [Planctomycetota bacterium]
MRKHRARLLAVVVLLALAVPVSAAEGPSWVQAMRQVHAAKKGERGVLVHMGDSITYSMAYAEVIRVVVNGQTPGVVSTTILGANPPKPGRLPKVKTPAAATRGAGLSVAPPEQGWFPKAPALPKPTGEIIGVQTVAGLYAAAAKVRPGGTILVADGLYCMPQTLHLQTDNVRLRSQSGDRTKVVLDFADCRHHEGVAVSHCSGVRIADLTVQNVRQNGIKINSNLGVDRVTIYNVIGHNVWQRHIKGPKVPDKNGQADFVEDCRVQYCLFYNDRPKHRGDEPWEDENPRMGFNYIGGIDIMSAKGWTISDNVFTGIGGKSGEARGAIFMWHNGADCTIERNIIIDCDTGICLGNSSARGPRRHANGFRVRNNFVVRCGESNILAAHTRDCKILNNTVHDPESRNGRLLRVVHANDGLLVANNIFSGPRIVTEHHEGSITLRNNLVRPMTDYFVDPAEGNLHLKAGAVDAIDKAIVDRDVAEDVDRQPRGDRPDLGADEFHREPR